MSCHLFENKCQMESQPRYIGAYDRSRIGNSPTASLDRLVLELEQIESEIGKGKVTIVLANEFNCRVIELSSSTVPPSS